MRISPGRLVYGLAAIGLGIAALVWHDFGIWQIAPPAAIAHRAGLIDAIAVLQILGAIAMQVRRTARLGTVVVGGLYAAFALFWFVHWLVAPLDYGPLGNFFEQFSMAAGAMIAFGGPTVRVGYYGFCASTASFAIVQAIHLRATAALVPAWIPPGQAFWAVVTTAAFALAAVALLTGRWALLAARLTTVMLAGFGVLVWIPLTVAASHALIPWAELLETFGICGAAWLLAEALVAGSLRPDGRPVTS